MTAPEPSGGRLAEQVMLDQADVALEAVESPADRVQSGIGDGCQRFDPGDELLLDSIDLGLKDVEF